MFDPNELQNLGIKHGTDKFDQAHSHCGESYLHIYQRYLEPYRQLPLNFLELGVKDGHSTRMWKEYFPNATIYGLDFDEKCKKHEEERIKITIASQDDEEVLSQLSKEVGGFDIILDDASHINSLTKRSFDILFSDHLKNDGIYLIEDLGNSHVDLAPMEGSWDCGGLIKNKSQGVDLSHKREDLDTLFADLIRRMDLGDTEVHMVHFWSKIAVIKKGIKQ